MLNATVCGNVGRDAEVREVGGSPVAEWSVAVNRKTRGGDETAWVRCSMWGTRGANVAPYLTKGKRVVVSGELWPREYEGSDGVTHVSLDMRVEAFDFAGGRNDGERQERRQSEPEPEPVAEGYAQGFATGADPFLDELPF